MGRDNSPAFSPENKLFVGAETPVKGVTAPIARKTDRRFFCAALLIDALFFPGVCIGMYMQWQCEQLDDQRFVVLECSL